MQTKGRIEMAQTTNVNEETNDEQRDFKNQHMRSAYYWAAQVNAWMTDGPNAGHEGCYYVQVRAGKPILVLDKSYSEEVVNHFRDSLDALIFDNGFLEGGDQTVTMRELDDEWRLFVEGHTDTDWLVSNYDDEWREFEGHTDFEDTELVI